MEVELLKRGVNVFHSGDEEIGSIVGVDEDFIANGDGIDFGGGVEMGYVGLYPIVGEGRIGGGGGEVFVGEGDDNGDVRVR